MTQQAIINPNSITFRDVRISFVQLDEAKAYGDNPVPYFTLEVLLDRSNAAHQAYEKWVKATAERLAVAEYGSVEVVEKRCFGSGDKRMRRGTKEPYDGYPGMYYVKLKGKQEQAAFQAKHFGAVMDRRMTRLANNNVAFISPGHPEWPYGGCYANVKGSMWALGKKTKGYAKGGPSLGMNLEAIQFVRQGVAFGRGPVNVEEEFEALPEEAGSTAPATATGAQAASVGGWD